MSVRDDADSFQRYFRSGPEVSGRRVPCPREGSRADAARLHDVRHIEVSVIGPDAFCGMKGITTVVLPEGVLEIERNRDYGQDHGAFNGCIRLQRVVFPSTLETIGAQAFLDCAALWDVAFYELAAGLYRLDMRHIVRPFDNPSK